MHYLARINHLLAFLFSFREAVKINDNTLNCLIKFVLMLIYVLSAVYRRMIFLILQIFLNFGKTVQKVLTRQVKNSKFTDSLVYF